MRLKVVLAALVVVGVVGGVAGGASAKQSAFSRQGAKGGKVEIWVSVPTTGAVSKIVLTGAIGDYGTATSADANGKVDDNGGYEDVKLSKGSFVVDSVAFNKHANSLKPQLSNVTTCTFEFEATGNVTVGKGTGAYAGISGTIALDERVAGVGPITGGKCNQNAQPLGFFGSVTGTGTLTFG